MGNDTFARKLEKDFSLPWHLQRVGEASEIITASGNPLFYIKCGKTEQDWNACKYLVHCANLMPEAVELLKSADEKLLDLCCTCVNAMSEAGYSVDCKNCNVESLDTNIKELLAKLEGGTDNAPNP